jgi:hypothetical protein
MLNAVHRWILRALLVVMLATLASPEFGRGLVSSHDELAHASAAHDHDDDAHHHDDDDHPDPHTNAGHLLAHMSVGCPGMPALIAPVQAREALSSTEPPVHCGATDPPYKPPRSLLAA